VQTLSANSGSWDKVGRKTLNIQLQKGQNTIRLSNASGWMPDIDYIDVEYVVPAAIETPQADQPSTTSNTPAYDLRGVPVKDQRQTHTIIIKNGKKVLR